MEHRKALQEQNEREEREAIERGDIEIVEEEEFLCQVCNKTFKHEKTMNQHLQTKKHKDNMKTFKESLALSPEEEA